jgi:hypothetical protein
VLDNVVRQNLLVRHIAFVDARGVVVARPTGAARGCRWCCPTAFSTACWPTRCPRWRSARRPTASSPRSEVLFFARAVTLADGSRMLAVAEVQLSLLTTIMTQGAGIRGLEVTLERDGGPMLASLPPRDDLTGKQIEPALREQTSDGRPSRMAARLSGLPAIVVARPTLHRNLLIVAGIPLTAALREWRRERDLIAWTAWPSG